MSYLNSSGKGMNDFMKLEAQVFLARCKNSRGLYGNRIQKDNGQWVANWSFPISENRAKSEGFDKVKIKIDNNFIWSEEYKGCPYCNSSGIFHCVCGKLTCWNGEKSSKCAWCGERVNLEAGSFDVLAGED